jgi:uncharacterized membrane protein YtjA (UPF0391 family)
MLLVSASGSAASEGVPPVLVHAAAAAEIQQSARMGEAYAARPRTASAARRSALALHLPFEGTRRRATMQRRLGFSFALALVAAVVGFGRFAADTLATTMKVVFVASLVLMLASVLFGRKRSTA